MKLSGKVAMGQWTND